QQVIKNMGRVRFSRFKNCFDKFYLSQHIHLTKPANSIYEFVLQSNNLQADECLFIDDLKENTEAALKMGIHVWNIIPTAQDVTQLFDLKTDIF
ncbi:HAD-IA family hydrolase, partial [Flavobacteriaceae bacterium]|nr:HAD-IA family hydrolase [Flavobacteriaceae bacterium]